MYKVLNILLIILILIFSFNIYKYYASNKNLKIKDYNRTNFDQIINDKTLNLPILDNDTNNVIEFNDTFSNEVINDKPRSFWNLLKSK
jgi:hypothetical protein|tara:strand:+ start:2501 stop:2764 length:264 start_codon:yes stop_codon:yes gene_type:complete